MLFGDKKHFSPICFYVGRLLQCLCQHDLSPKLQYRQIALIILSAYTTHILKYKEGIKSFLLVYQECPSSITLWTLSCTVYCKHKKFHCCCAWYQWTTNSIHIMIVLLLTTLSWYSNKVVHVCTVTVCIHIYLFYFQALSLFSIIPFGLLIAVVIVTIKAKRKPDI